MPSAENSAQYFYFSAFDASWKAEHEGPQGACWGVLTETGEMKSDIEGVLQRLVYSKG